MRSIVRASLLLLALTALPARAQMAVPRMPTGPLELRGTAQGESGATVPLEGLLTIAPVETGFVVSRTIRARAGSPATTWSGVASAAGDALTVTFGSSDGLVGVVLGGAPTTTRVTYRLEADGGLRGRFTAGGATIDEVARPGARTRAGAKLSKDEYFAFLDHDPGFRAQGALDALTALLDLIARDDVPAALDRSYAAKAGSPGAGRLLMVLDYTRGIGGEPTWWEALKGGPKKVVASKLLTPMLTHFREVDGHTVFPGDVGFVRPFRDSALTSAGTNQVGHMLCALESGVRLGYYERRPFRRRMFELSMRVANRAFGLKNVKPTVADWSRAGIIGHEMIGDDDGSGFLGQMNTYGRLIGDSDADGIRAAWDRAVAAVLAGDHVTAWTAIRHIARAAEVPETVAEQQANRVNPHPRFAKPGDARGGNTLADLGLSVYGFALGYRSSTAGYPTPAAARAGLEAFLAARGEGAHDVDRASSITRGGL